MVELNNILNHSLCGLNERPSREVVKDLIFQLQKAKTTHTCESWKTACETIVQKHELHTILMEDPYTRRAFQKPRGYPGDGVMMDYLYFGSRSDYIFPDDISTLGRYVFMETVGCPSGQAVRNRRKIIARYVDMVASNRCEPFILSLAAGHLREANLSQSLIKGKIARWLALDQDISSLKVIQQQYERFPEILPAKCSVKDLLNGEKSFRGYDFIYTAGLFDYLTDQLAATLVENLFARLSPGGRLLISNFASDSAESAYMEACMNWWLKYRSEEEMEAIIRNVPKGKLKRKRLFRDKTGRIIFYSIIKK